jgi:hypothetical protein
MMRERARRVLGFLAAFLAVMVQCSAGAEDRPLTVSWENEMLTIRGPDLAGGELSVWYMEAFCRPGSTSRDWHDTVIKHKTRKLEADPHGRLLRLRSELEDGVVVDHEIRAGTDEVNFHILATNPGATESQAHWAQPCIRVDRFTGTKAERNSEAYLPSCFVFVDGKPVRMPTQPWAREAKYTPGQVWCPAPVPRADVNPRPLSPLVPSNGLIGCFSADGRHVMATAWEPYQELFQGVIVCLHSDFRIGGLKPGESKTIRGKIYLMPADLDALLARYRRDFPGQDRGGYSSRQGVRPRKLIEFGWDEPDTAFLRKYQRIVESAPFDGCVFRIMTSSKEKPAENFTWLCWGRRRFTDDELAGALGDLRAISWTRFRHNFLRFNVTPGDLDWFDDHSAVLANARLAARLAKSGRCRGILLDTEQYEKGLFNYHKQRDAGRKPWLDYAEQVRKRGREFAAALQAESPDLTLMATFGPSLLWRQSQQGKKPLADCDYGLLVPFFDGLIEGANGEFRIVDGHEPSYGYKEAVRFEQGYEVMTERASGLMRDPLAYRRVISAAFGIWLDYDWRNRGWKTGRPEMNYFSPERFQAALRAALERSDEFVWIYSETPRWWTQEGKTRDLPAAYVRSIRQARQGLCSD